jgi:hypothetical protein
MTKARLRLLDTEAIAWHYGVAPGTVRRWACQAKWRPYGSRKHRLWNLTEVDAWKREQGRLAHDRDTCA